MRITVKRTLATALLWVTLVGLAFGLPSFGDRQDDEQDARLDRMENTLNGVDQKVDQLIEQIRSNHTQIAVVEERVYSVSALLAIVISGTGAVILKTHFKEK
jgi:hypothetical protein